MPAAESRAFSDWREGRGYRFVPARMSAAANKTRPLLAPWPPPATNVLVALGAAALAWQWTLFLLTESDFLRTFIVPASAWKTILTGLGDSESVRIFGAWSLEGLRAGYWWQPISHLFVHDGILPAVFSFAFLYAAGKSIEPIIGRRHLAGMFLAGAWAGGLFQLLAEPHARLLGASSATYAVLFAALTIRGAHDLRSIAPLAWLPVPFRARHLAAGIVATLIVSFLVENSAAVSPNMLYTGSLAHLIACLAGWTYARALGFARRPDFPAWPSPASPPVRPASPPVAIPEEEEEPDPHAFIRDSIDPILEKIRASGMDSLTPDERRRLERASAMLK